MSGVHVRTIQDGTHVWALTDTVAGRAPAHQLADLIAIIEARSQATNRMPSPKTYFLTLVTTTACNLRCPYCFQNTAVAPGGGPGAVQRVPATFMTRATLSLALDWVASQMQASGASTLHLLLFGGEPLLKPPLCLAALRGSRSLGLTDASMVTNGVYLTPDLATQLEAAALTALQVTLDGPRSTHDNLRISVSTPETFDLIVSNVRACADQTSIGLTVRVNVTNAALDSLPHLLHDLARHLPPDRIRIDLVPVRTYQSPPMVTTTPTWMSP